MLKPNSRSRPRLLVTGLACHAPVASGLLACASGVPGASA
jgi:hypothetical protein